MDFTHRMVIPTGVHAATVLQWDTFVIAEDEAWVTFTTLYAHVLAAGWADHAQAGFRAGAHAQGVGAVRGAGDGCMEVER